MGNMFSRQKIWSAVCLFGGLLAVNLAAAWLLPTQWDLTRQAAFTLSPQTCEALQKIDGSLEIVLFAPRQPRTAAERSFQNISPLLRDLAELYGQAGAIGWRELDPDQTAAARDLQRKFPDVSSPAVVVVCQNGDQVQHEVLGYGDLVDVRVNPTGQISRVDFLGEQALTAAIRRLETGRRQTIVSVVTGHGELSLDDLALNSRKGLGLLATRLRTIDCELRPLDLRANPSIPPETDLLLIAGPRQPFSAAEVEALQRYVRHDRPLLLFLDLVVEPGSRKPVSTGLETLLAKQGVVVGQDRVITRGFTGDIEAASPALVAAGEHPLLRTLPPGTLTLFECRSVRRLESFEQHQNSIIPLLLSHAAPRAWAEGDLVALRGSQPGGAGDTDGPVSMAVAVEHQVGAVTQPLMVVVGDAEFLSNRSLSEDTGGSSFGLMAASLRWLQGRKTGLSDIPPRRHEPYRLSGEAADHRSLVWKSTLLLAAVVITWTTTVWTVRRIG
jgi:hypothetical protein